MLGLISGVNDVNGYDTKNEAFCLGLGILSFARLRQQNALVKDTVTRALPGVPQKLAHVGVIQLDGITCVISDC